MTLHSFSRTELLIGSKGLEKLKNSKVAIFGIGGVGSFAAEALARSGVYGFVLVDDDHICLTNINRQIHALHSTVGRPKVEIMKMRILDINPEATVTVYKESYNSESSKILLSDDYDYVVDAIDMVGSKLDLIERCKKRNIPIISSMGMGNKLDPTKPEVADIYDTSVCSLARAVRKQLRKKGIKDLKVVYSKEEPIKLSDIDDSNYGSNSMLLNKDRTHIVGHRILGSVPFVPSVAGLIIASEVVSDLIQI
ncbi:MAG TPA: tRNA threonylcarbamoyladenosine dehydratase [Oscillospiraceae bacterium]|nr:tRNA threonylcarbamoyladenosine dehydratase [Oscillospiraceae bacterium]